MTLDLPRNDDFVSEQCVQIGAEAFKYAFQTDQSLRKWLRFSAPWDLSLSGAFFIRCRHWATRFAINAFAGPVQ